MPKFTLLLDMDGPLADFDAAVWDLVVRNRWETNIESLDDPNRQRFMTDNMTYPSEARQLRNTINGTRWFRDLRPTLGAKSGVLELMQLFDVWVCTKPLEVNTFCHHDKMGWIRNYFPHLANKMIIAPNKGMVQGHILLDDAPKHDWFPYATWKPVVFRSGFNESPGNPWEGLPLWTWGDDPEDLLKRAGLV